MYRVLIRFRAHTDAHVHHAYYSKRTRTIVNARVRLPSNARVHRGNPRSRAHTHARTRNELAQCAAHTSPSLLPLVRRYCYSRV